MADQNPYSAANSPYAVDTSSPFAEYLQFAQPAPGVSGQPQQQPSGYEAKTGRMAYFLDSFLRGAQAGTARKQQQELAKERASDNAVNQMIQILQTKDPQQAAPLMQQILLAKGQAAMSFLDQGTKGKGSKDQPGSHVLNALKSIGTGLMGGKVEKWKGYGDKMGEWATAIANMPSKEDAQARDLSTFNALTAQEAKKISDNSGGRQPYLNELVSNPGLNNLANRITSLYGVDPRAGWQTAYAQDPTLSMTAEEKAAKLEEDRTRAITAKMEREAIEGTYGQTQGGAAPPQQPGMFMVGPGGRAPGQQAQPRTGGGVSQRLEAPMEERLRTLKGWIQDENMTIGGRTDVPVKHVMRGPWIGYYDASGNRIPDQMIASEAGRPYETAEEARKARREEWGHEEDVRSRERREDKAEARSYQIERDFEAKKDARVSRNTDRIVQINQWAATNFIPDAQRDAVISKAQEQFRAVDAYYDAMHENMKRLTESGQAPREVDPKVARSTSSALNNPGMLRGNDGEFMAFDTAKQGWDAMKERLGTWVSGNNTHGLNKNSTIYDLMAVYSPYGDGGNDPIAAARNIAKNMGVTPETKIGDLSGRMDDLAAAIATQEGRTPKTVIDQLRGSSSRAATPPPPGGPPSGNVVSAGSLMNQR